MRFNTRDSPGGILPKQVAARNQSARHRRRCRARDQVKSGVTAQSRAGVSVFPRLTDYSRPTSLSEDKEGPPPPPLLPPSWISRRGVIVISPTLLSETISPGSSCPFSFLAPGEYAHSAPLCASVRGEKPVLTGLDYRISGLFIATSVCGFAAGERNQRRGARPSKCARTPAQIRVRS